VSRSAPFCARASSFATNSFWAGVLVSLFTKKAARQADPASLHAYLTLEDAWRRIVGEQRRGMPASAYCLTKFAA